MAAPLNAASPYATLVEKRIAILARRTARLAQGLRNQGEHAGADRLIAVVVEIVADMRRGK